MYKNTINPAQGTVFWVTGLSGAGKTTIGLRLLKRLKHAGRSAIFLDGDALRSAIADELGHEASDRRRSAFRNARLCKLLSDQGFDIVCSTISLFHEVQEWNRANISGYQEIYLRVPRPELEARDPKGLYAAARGGRNPNIVGLDVHAEEPVRPHLVIDNYGPMTPDGAVELIWRHVVEQLPLPDSGAPSRAAQDAAIEFGTKAETLERLAPVLGSAEVLPQVRFTVQDWSVNPEAVMALVASQAWAARSLIVRSSSQSEDMGCGSLAGRYASVGDVADPDALRRAIAHVIASFGAEVSLDDQVFVQPMLDDIALAGVAFSRDPNGGGPYIVVNYEDRSRRADVVTSGSQGHIKTYYRHRTCTEAAPAHLAGVVRLVEELETRLEHEALDLEFAVNRKGRVTLLQVRRLAPAAGDWIDADRHGAEVSAIARKVQLLSRPHPFLRGKRSVFGVMPDWNPAEIIGLRPRPLALSLYRELVTDAIWAYQRDNYGYRNLRSFPLLVSFHGLPYIDVRVSFNSFVPRDIADGLAERLVDYYVDRLVAQPDLHDKVEFEIIYSCYTFDLPQRLEALRERGFSAADTATLTDSLRALTNRVSHVETGLWRLDREKIDLLAQRLPMLHGAAIDTIGRVYWLLEDCKRYGTLPFAGLARAGFIAMQILRSLVSVGILDRSDYATYMASLDTVGSRIGRDLAHLPKQEFLARYGHLRPGTYDILSPRYDEEPDRYFDWSTARRHEQALPGFALSTHQGRGIDSLLRQHGLDHDAAGLMAFVKAGIEGREHAKFVFTRHLSDALKLIKQLGSEHGLSLEDCAFLDIATIRSLYGESGQVAERLKIDAAQGRRKHDLVRSLVLPPLIVEPRDCREFQLPPTQPNFITQRSVTAPVTTLDAPPESIAGKILFIPSADPGFDWIFTRRIGGFVTQFGGVNSHMAIRANELGLPAVIGAGEALYASWRTARALCIDCGNQQVQILS